VTRNVSDALLPASSVAVQRTVVVPTGNVLPLAGEHETPTLPLTASVAVGDGQKTAAPSAFAVVTDLSPGTLYRTGSVVSRTTMLNVPVEWFPDASLPVQWTLVVPSPNVEPEAGEQLTVGDGSTASDALTL
jgi:hypothetical protein